MSPPATLSVAHLDKFPERPDLPTKVFRSREKICVVHIVHLNVLTKAFALIKEKICILYNHYVLLKVEANVGNNVLISCKVPESNPPAIVQVVFFAVSRK